MNNQGMTLIVKTVTRITVWMIILYGIYIILHGHLTPGGGFGGGVIIALALLNVMLAYGREYSGNWLNLKLLKDFESSSAVIFFVIGLLGIASGGLFLSNFLSHGTLFRLISSGTILPFNILIGIKVGMSLFIAVWLLAAFNIEGDEQ